MNKLSLISLLLLASQNLMAMVMPNDFNAVYAIEKYGANIIEMELVLRTQDTNIHYSSHSKTTGMLAVFNDDKIDESSQLRWHKKQAHLQLLDYKFTRKEDDNKNQHYSLHQEANNVWQVQGEYAGKKFTLSTPDAVWDPLSIQLAFAGELKSDKEIKNYYSFNIIDEGKLIQYHFIRQQDEIIEIAGKQYKTVQFKRPHGTRATFLWLAKELDFLPVKIEQYKKNEYQMSINLNSFKFLKDHYDK